MEIMPAGPTGLISVRFSPWGAYHFFRSPVSELADRAVAADQLWGNSVHLLEQRIGEADSLKARVALVERFLLNQLQRHQKVDIEGLVHAIWSRRGQVRVAQMCREIGVSERQRQRIFKTAIGMPPKAFARLSRFLHSCAVLRAGSWTTLTEVSHNCGYYDQAHFIADFQDFAGMTPRRFLANSNFSFLDLS